MMEGTIIHVWDLPLRLFHWLLVLSITLAYVTSYIGGTWLEWHAHLGVFTLALLMFRIAWGFMGPTYAQFSHFAPTPARIHAFFSSPWTSVGHTPIGALSVFALLGMTFAQAGSGLFSLNDEIEFHGPLYDLVSANASKRLTGWHTRGFNILLAIIGLHVSAIAYYSRFKRKNLTLPMITGTMRISEKMQVQPVRGGGKIHCLVSVAIAVTLFWCIESGALLQWLTPSDSIAHESTTTAW
jgi:cytochrome b